MNFSRNKSSACFRFTAAWCALLLYAGTCSPLGLGLAALTGSLDPNHDLLSGATEHGIRLVLHHANRSASHHHGLAACALTLFAQPANAAAPDHVLQFSSADTLKVEPRSSAPQPGSRHALLIFPGSDFLARAPKVFAAGIPLGSLPPVDAAGRCLRSIVLLI